MEQNEKKSKGLIAVIVIIALVVVLFAIFTPIGLRHIEKDNREADVTKALEIANVVVTNANSEHPTIIFGSPVVANPETVPELTEEPLTKGNAVEKGVPFTYYYVKQGNSCAVYVGDDRQYNLNNPTQAQQYVNK